MGSATQAQGPDCGCPTVGFLGHSSSPPHRACDPIPSGHAPHPPWPTGSAPAEEWGERSHRQKPTAVGPRATRLATSAGAASRQGDFQKHGPRLLSGREGGGGGAAESPRGATGSGGSATTAQAVSPHLSTRQGKAGPKGHCLSQVGKRGGSCTVIGTGIQDV